MLINVRDRNRARGAICPVEWKLFTTKVLILRWRSVYNAELRLFQVVRNDDDVLVQWLVMKNGAKVAYKSAINILTTLEPHVTEELQLRDYTTIW